MGGPLCGEKHVPFYTESSKKSISLGNAEPDHFEFSDKTYFEPHKNCPGRSHFLLIHHYLATQFGLGQQKCAQVV